MSDFLYTKLYLFGINRQIDTKLLIYSALWGGLNAFTHSGELREDNDIKQEAVAEFLNVRQATYSRYETGQRATPIEILIELAGYYGTSVDYLLGITDQKAAYKPINRHVSKLLQLSETPH